MSAALLGGLVFLTDPSSIHAANLLSALTRAYVGNPDVNQKRTSVRAQDDEASKALAGIRPSASRSGRPARP